MIGAQSVFEFGLSYEKPQRVSQNAAASSHIHYLTYFTFFNPSYSLLYII